MRSIRLPLAVVLLGGVGCATVRPVAQPAQFIPHANPDVVLVVYKDNSQVPVSKPHMSGDTLVGTWLGLGEAVVAPMSEVQRIDARQRDRKRTTLLIAGLTLFTAVGTYAVIQAATGNGRICDYSAGGPGDNCVGEGYDGPGP